MINVLKNRDDKIGNFYKNNYIKNQIKYFGLEVSEVSLGS